MVASLVPLVLLSAIGILVTGCEVGPNYKRPATTMPAAFSLLPASTQPAALAVDTSQWWKALNDAELDSLIGRAVRNNSNVQIALMHLQEAREYEYVASGSALPELDAAGGAGRGSGTNSTKGRVPGPLNAGTNTTGLKEITEVAGLDAAWNLDLFGGLRRQIEAAKYDAQAAVEARNQALVTVISEVAAAYIDQRGVEFRLQIANDNIAGQQNSFNLVQARFQRGFTNELDLALAQRQLAEVQAEVTPLEAARLADERRLAVLLGQFPGSLRVELRKKSALPMLSERIAPGLPIELLRRRPDIRQAERQLAAATARIGVETDALYPHVVLTGGLGFQGQGLGRSPVENSFIGSIGPAAYWPLLDFGTLDALVHVQDYRTRALLLNYQQTILTAVEQVDDAIDNYDSQQELLRKLSVALNAADQAERVASQRYTRGFTNYLDVLDAQRELFALQAQYVTTQEQVVLEFIQLYQALGGGWENYQAIPAIHKPRPAIIAAINHLNSKNDTQK